MKYGQPWIKLSRSMAPPTWPRPNDGNLSTTIPLFFEILFQGLGGWLLAVLCTLLILFAPLPLPGAVPTDRHIRIEASQFQYTPAELKVNPGDRVTVELISTDVVHGFSIDGYAFELRADPGQTATGSFVADKAGVFRFRCSIPCGNLHPFMLGKLQVGPNLLFLRGIALGLLAILAASLSMRKSSPSIELSPTL
jgi:heme/copper-type cytochrome/quinol oxidase subunit 2